MIRSYLIVYIRLINLPITNYVYHKVTNRLNINDKDHRVPTDRFDIRCLIRLEME